MAITRHNLMDKDYAHKHQFKFNLAAQDVLHSLKFSPTEADRYLDQAALKIRALVVGRRSEERKQQKAKARGQTMKEYRESQKGQKRGRKRKNMNVDFEIDAVLTEEFPEEQLTELPADKAATPSPVDATTATAPFPEEPA